MSASSSSKKPSPAGRQQKAAPPKRKTKVSTVSSFLAQPTQANLELLSDVSSPLIQARNSSGQSGLGSQSEIIRSVTVFYKDVVNAANLPWDQFGLTIDSLPGVVTSGFTSGQLVRVRAYLQRPGPFRQLNLTNPAAGTAETGTIRDSTNDAYLIICGIPMSLAVFGSAASTLPLSDTVLAASRTTMVTCSNTRDWMLVFDAPIRKLQSQGYILRNSNTGQVTQIAAVAILDPSTGKPFVTGSPAAATTDYSLKFVVEYSETVDQSQSIGFGKLATGTPVEQGPSIVAATAAYNKALSVRQVS